MSVPGNTGFDPNVRQQQPRRLAPLPAPPAVPMRGGQVVAVRPGQPPLIAPFQAPPAPPAGGPLPPIVHPDAAALAAANARREHEQVGPPPVPGGAPPAPQAFARGAGHGQPLLGRVRQGPPPRMQGGPEREPVGPKKT